MDMLIERCAGLDVHRDTVVATVLAAGQLGRNARRSSTRGPSPRSRGRHEALADWLAEHRVTLVGMEATGVYWKPVVRHEAL